jgi:hypothetical protein
MLWLGLGPALRFEATLSSVVTVELEGSALGLLRSDRFMFDPEVVAHHVPPWAFGFSVGPVFRLD